VVGITLTDTTVFLLSKYSLIIITEKGGGGFSLLVVGQKFACFWILVISICYLQWLVLFVCNWKKNH